MMILSFAFAIRKYSATHIIKNLRNLFTTRLDSFNITLSSPSYAHMH